MGSEYAEVDEEFRYRFGYHGAATVGVDGMWAGVIAVDGVVEEVFRHDGVLGCGDQPSRDIARVNVEDDVAFVPDSFCGSFQSGDIPGPDLAGAVGDEFGPDPRGVGGQAAAFADLAGGAGDPVHRGDRAPVPAFVELTRPHLRDREVSVGRAGQQLEDLGSFGGVERVRWWRAGQPGAVQRSFRVDVAVVGRSGFPGQRARFLHGNIGGA